MKKKYLQRAFKATQVSEDGTFEGYGSVFGNLDSYRDVVVRGAFEKTAAEYAESNRRVKMLWQHDSRNPIGGYPMVKEDDYGLFVKGEINLEVQQGRECHALLKKGDLEGLSIGYETEVSEFDEKKLITTLKVVKLWEISPVTFPANDLARVSSVKSYDDIKTYSDVEDYLRERGLSQKEATTIVACVKRVQTGPSDSDAAEKAKLLEMFKSFSQ